MNATTAFKVTLTDRSELARTLEQIKGLLAGDSCSYNPKRLLSRLRAIANGQEKELMEPDYEFRDFLTGVRPDGKPPLFQSFNKLGGMLAKLPRAHYTNPKTVATQLWYIWKEPRHIPDTMANEICRCFIELYGTGLNGDFKTTVDEFNKIVLRHNQQVRMLQTQAQAS